MTKGIIYLSAVRGRNQSGKIDPPGQGGMMAGCESALSSSRSLQLAPLELV